MVWRNDHWSLETNARSVSVVWQAQKHEHKEVKDKVDVKQ